MGRRAGVTAEQTRSTLLSAAADIFAAKGYDGASSSDICTAASLTSGVYFYTLEVAGLAETRKMILVK